MVTDHESVGELPRSPPEVNLRVASMLMEFADLLEKSGEDNPYRIIAYRRAASVISQEARDLNEIASDHEKGGLISLPGVGHGLASIIEEFLKTGRSVQLDYLRWSMEPIRVLESVPGIGHHLARQMVWKLGIRTLEDLEVAARQGKLLSIPGIGRRKAMAVLSMFEPEDKSPRGMEGGPEGLEVNLLLDVDREYQEKVRQGRLQRIAPRLFNPTRAPWLPVLHTSRGVWHFTAMYSNTANAHLTGKIRDWVVIYCYRGGELEARYTVVTESKGEWSGLRVIRGREDECRRYYGAAAA